MATATEDGFYALLYGLLLVWCFMGVEIVADRFMSAIEVITSKEKEKTVRDPSTGETKRIKVKVWNETVANLTLMAVGTSAPEILLATIETVFSLGKEPGELGAGTIVGSAAFNLLMISAVITWGMGGEEPRRIKNFDVFIVTTIFSLFAYFWLFVVLLVWTPEVVTLAEALITLACFPVLVIVAFGKDTGLFSGGRRDPHEQHIISLEIEDENVRKSTLALMLKKVIRYEHPSSKKKKTKDGDADADGDADGEGSSPLLRDREEHLEGRTIDEATAQELEDHATRALLQRQQGGVSRMRYRINAIRGMAGGRRVLPSVLSKKAEEEKRLKAEAEKDRAHEVPKDPKAARRASVAMSPLGASAGGGGAGGGAGGDMPMAFTGADVFHAEQVAAEAHGRIKFSSYQYSCMEDCGKITITVVRDAGTGGEVSVSYRTVAAKKKGGEEDKHIATEGEDFKATAGVLTFTEGQTSATFDVEILDDDKFEEDEHFYVVLYSVAGGAVLGNPSQAQVVIHDDDDPGVFHMALAERAVTESIGCAHIRVMRSHGARGSVTVKYETADGTAQAGEDYEETKGELVFDEGEDAKDIIIPIIDDVKWERDETFTVKLTAVSGEARLEEGADTTTVHIRNDDQVREIIEHISNLAREREKDLSVATSSWTQQFLDAMSISGDTDEAGVRQQPSIGDFINHALTFYWKCVFACIPPTDYYDGYATFGVALAMIGALTATIGTLAENFGAHAGLQDYVTAITFVAVGTSVPDTFASLLAARADKHADAAVGNITGSNAVNVFLGLGLPWTIAAIYSEANDEDYAVAGGASLAFGVVVFFITGTLSLSLFYYRRCFHGGELGGDVTASKIHGVIFGILWFVYIILSSLQAYGHIFPDNSSTA